MSAQQKMSDSDNSLRNVVHCVERVEADRALSPIDRARRVAAVQDWHASERVYERAGCAKRESLLERFVGKLAIMRHDANAKAAERQRHSITLAMFDRRMGMPDRLLKVLLAHSAAHINNFVGPGGKAVRESICRL